MCASARIERPDFISKRNKKDMLLKKLLFGKKQIGNSEYESRNSEEKIEFRNVYQFIWWRKRTAHLT